MDTKKIQSPFRSSVSRWGLGIAGIAMMGLVATSCSAPRYSKEEQKQQKALAQRTLEDFEAAIDGFDERRDASYAVAVFPRIASGAAGVGAASGEGIVLRDDRVVGSARLTEVSAGPQLGGQTYREVLLFETAADFEEFVDGSFQFTADATATAGPEGAAAMTGLNDGVVAYAMSGEGLIAAASLGVQGFSYRDR
jgi:lipid-binding SYLF domain-containing protein